MCYHDEKYIIRVRNCARIHHIPIASILLTILLDHRCTGVPWIQVAYNARRPLKDLSSEEFVLGVKSDKEISMTGSTPKTNSSELRSLSGRLTLYAVGL